MAFVELTTSEAAGQDISLPAPPKPALPPTTPREKSPQTIREHERTQKAEEQRVQETRDLELTREKEREAKVIADAQKPRHYYGFLEASLLQPKAVVSSGRSNYVSDVTSHISAYARPLYALQPEQTQAWIGLRIAPFVGYGTQKSLTARYAHTWIGPALGLGQIRPAEMALPDRPIRHFWMISAGIAALNRLVADDESSPPLPDDFRPTPWAYDAPGAWSEFRWTRITRGALGFGVLAGAQTGRGKIFYYAGATVSGFY